MSTFGKVINEDEYFEIWLQIVEKLEYQGLDVCKMVKQVFENKVTNEIWVTYTHRNYGEYIGTYTTLRDLSKENAILSEKCLERYKNIRK